MAEQRQYFRQCRFTSSFRDLLHFAIDSSEYFSTFPLILLLLISHFRQTRKAIVQIQGFISH